MTAQTSKGADHRRVAVAISGGGRSLANLLECAEENRGYQIAAVIASSPAIGGVPIAKAAGLPLFVGDFSRDALAKTEGELYQWLADHQIHWIALAGFLKLFPVHPSWQGRIVNIHPALLPDFDGKGMYGDRVHTAVIASGVQKSGATIHFVNERYDDGQRIAAIEVPVLKSDRPETLAARVFAAEKVLYPQVLNRLVDGTLPRFDGQVELISHE